MKVYTIGHSNHNLTEFIEILVKAGIQVLVDVRSQPYSQYAIQYNREPFSQWLLKNGIEYVFAGDELGGRPKGEEFYDDEGKVLYGKYRYSNQFQSGITRLDGLTRNREVVLLCSEENPATCHRKLLIGRYLTDRGDEVYHIRGDGNIQTDAEVNQSMSGANEAQMGLFDLRETLEWKSLRSVSPRKAQKSFSRN